MILPAVKHVNLMVVKCCRTADEISKGEHLKEGGYEGQGSGIPSRRKEFPQKDVILPAVNHVNLMVVQCCRTAGEIGKGGTF